MKIRLPGCRQTRYPSIRRCLAVAAFSVFLASCGGGGGDDSPSLDDPGDGGIIGTGIQLRGTVPTERLPATATVLVKASSGETSSAVVAQNGSYQIDSVAGDSPFLLQIDIGNSQAFFSIAHAQGATNVTQNLHAYTDLATRNWFATQGEDIDSAFTSPGPIARLPSVNEINAIDQSISALIEPSLALFGLAGTDLSSVSFVSDDTGVDQFLDRNPVLINNGNVTIIIAGPGTGIQTIVSSDLPLDTVLTATDTIPPTAPIGLRALPSASDEIVLAWNAASDNIGVTSYVVFRDGVPVDTTIFPTYIDSPLASGTTFTYSVASVDSSGNQSLPSEPANSQTLAAPDTQAPPSATDLVFAATNSSLQVSWTQSDIADVASFTVLRGTTTTMLNQIALVTSTSLTDAGLRSGTEFCYQVITTDASLNDSAPSEIACASTTGTPVSDQPDTETTPPATTGGLTDVDVSNISCTVEFNDTAIREAVVLNEPCYIVNRTINVRQGASITVEAGTVLKFASGAGIDVNNGAFLMANGTANAPVVFSAIDRVAGSWTGIVYNGSNSSSNVLSHTVIEYAGADDSEANLRLFDGVTPSRIVIDNVLLRHSASSGFNISGDTFIEPTQGLISTQNAISGTITANLAGAISADSRLTGNTIDGLAIMSSVNEASEWKVTDVPYLLDRLLVAAPLSVPAGAELRFSSGALLDVSFQGSLSAIGTSSAPILFTAVDNTPGFWQGLEFDQSNSSNNRLEHVIVEYAGGPDARDAGVVTRGSVNVPSRIAMNNVTFRFNAGSGFVILGDTVLDQFSNITSTSNGNPGKIDWVSAGAMDGSNLQFTGNTRDQLELMGSSVRSALTLSTLDVPYLFDRVIVFGSQLTLSPGVTMRALAAAQISINSTSALNAVGTPTQPITIVGDMAIPGFWEGIELSQSASPLNVLSHVTLSHGGGGNTATSGNIRMNCVPQAASRVSIDNSTISDSLGWGIYRSRQECDAIVGANVTFSGNAQGNINTP